MSRVPSVTYRAAGTTLLLLGIGANGVLVLLLLGRVMGLRISGTIALAALALVIAVFAGTAWTYRSIGFDATLSIEERDRFRKQILGLGPLGVLETFLVLRRKRKAHP